MVTMKTLTDRGEWLEHRKKYIGGSDASAIMGLNPYMTNVELWQIKRGQLVQEDISDKTFVQYGIQAEPYLRELFRLDHPGYDVEYTENNSWLNDKYPWSAASLDGVLTEKETGRMGILEIKTTNILQSMQKEKWTDQIPDNYYIQVLHYLMVTEFDFCILKAQLKTVFDREIYLQTKHYHIEREDVEEDIQLLAAEEEKFWECVKKRRRPALKLPEI